MNPSVTIAMLTYRRNDDARRTLGELRRQVAATGDWDVSVLVVDNDATGGAEQIVRDLQWSSLRYVVEPTPGIAAARNRALDEAGSDLLVFIDDDESPQGRWLAELLEVFGASEADAVAGPVVSQFDGELDPWIVAGGFFDRRHREAIKTGDRIDTAATNNLLLDLRVARRLDVRFDERFGITGGSDTMFTRAFTGSGGRMIWCAEAIVIDRVPAGRMTRRWVLGRVYGHGATRSRVDVALASSQVTRSRARLLAVSRGLARVGGGALRYLLGLASADTRRQARGLRTAAHGAGMITGSVGRAPLIYHDTSTPIRTASEKR